MNYLIQPSRTAFWRFALAITIVLSLLAFRDLIDLAGRLQVNILTSRSWMAVLILLSITALMSLSGLAIGFSKNRDSLWDRFEALSQIAGQARWIGILLTLVALTGFSLITSNSYFRRILGGEGGVRLLIFWGFSLIGMWGIRIVRKEIALPTSLLIVVLGQTALHTVLAYLPLVTSYPFAMGWSETSRYYFPSLFLSEKIYGEGYPWPILHPTLHILLVPPYLFDAPLWFHRFWQVMIRFALVGGIVPALLKRLSIDGRAVRRFAGLWMFVFLFTGPVYFHLAVPVIILLVGFPHQDELRTLRAGSAGAWAAVILASIWCGWSRINWYPMPGMIAAVLYLLEAPVDGRSPWRYLSKPFLWFTVGTALAIASQRVYFMLSGIPESSQFFTSLTSDLLWYRLLPNASYPPGILFMALLVSLPVWMILYLRIRSDRTGLHPLRFALLFAALLVLFAGGLLVSLKIGGGADLHNMDAYLTLLLVVFSHLGFARYRCEDGSPAQPSPLHWAAIAPLVFIPALILTRPNIGFKTYDASRTQAVLEALQERVDQINAQGGEVLFITQRHLISMHMLHDVPLVPEYEREDIMEMAMGNNEEYLRTFRKDMEDQRFALIVVDPLNFNILTKYRRFAEENNVWVRRVVKQILCNYRQDAIFPEDEIALYVPQEGPRQCP